MHRIRRTVALALTVLVGAAACATHEARPAFRRGLAFGDRGISVPLPPPSLVEAEVEGTTEGKDPIVAGTKLVIEDIEGTASAELTLDAGESSFKVEKLEIRIDHHCFEAWLETPDGRESEHFFIHGVLVDANTFETVEGCD
ncbi:MAG TPA: hypothetical protein VG755_14790 [Nannocystaceae bacterium]|nr:hypothetical protein [Nannocystaceae bacterium]